MISDRSFNLLVGWLTITAIILLAVLLTACSADYLRERPDIATDLHKYCLNYPKDSACQGKDSK
jgi:hypothetical protein